MALLDGTPSSAAACCIRDVPAPLLHHPRLTSAPLPALPREPTLQARTSWESFHSTPPGSQQPQQAAAALAAGLVHTPGLAGQGQVNEAVVAAAMAAGMTFMQHLQAAGAAGGAQPSPFADINPLRMAAAAAAATAAGSSAVPLGPAVSGSAAASPEVLPAGSGGSVAAGAATVPRQLIAEMVARMHLGEEATAEQLEAASAQLHSQALAKQQQQLASQPAASLQGSVGSAASADHLHQQQAAGEAGLRKSWHAFEDAPQYHQAGQENQQPSAAASPTKPSRLGRQGGAQAAAAPAAPRPQVVARLAPPPVEGIAGWAAMSREDVARCEAIFTKKVCLQLCGRGPGRGGSAGLSVWLGRRQALPQHRSPAGPCLPACSRCLRPPLMSALPTGLPRGGRHGAAQRDGVLCES